MTDDKRAAKRGLGRGLSALFGEIEAPAALKAPHAPPIVETPAGEELRLAPIADMEPNPRQPRKGFGEAELEELAASIRERGLLQPVLIRPNPRAGQGGAPYEIVAGERRWRAAQRAGLEHLPALLRPLDDAATLEIALVENIQRADLGPLEEAGGYAELINACGYTQEKLAQSLGKSRSHIANMLRLLSLPAEIRALLTEGLLTAGHARALITAPDPVALARLAAAKGLSVREVERLAQQKKEEKAEPAAKEDKSADAESLAQALTAALRAPVSIQKKGKGGRLVISYGSLEELDDLCARLGLEG